MPSSLPSVIQRITLAVAALLLACCAPPPPPPVTVAVYFSTRACMVETKVLPCAEAAIYLHDVLKLPADRQIIVSATLSDPAPKEDPMLDLIAAGITKAGFKDVRTARFDLQ